MASFRNSNYNLTNFTNNDFFQFGEIFRGGAGLATISLFNTYYKSTLNLNLIGISAGVGLGLAGIPGENCLEKALFEDIGSYELNNLISMAKNTSYNSPLYVFNGFHIHQSQLELCTITAVGASLVLGPSATGWIIVFTLAGTFPYAFAVSAGLGIGLPDVSTNLQGFVVRSVS